MKAAFGDRRAAVGIVGTKGRIGRNEIQHDYFDAMLRSKIVVTCNPDRWEGDYRLFEALSCRCLVLVDRMITPTKHPLEDGKHLVYYDTERDLVERIEHYMRTPGEMERIARAGHRFALEHHTTRHRIDEIIEAFHDRVAEGRRARWRRIVAHAVKETPRSVASSALGRLARIWPGAPGY